MGNVSLPRPAGQLLPLGTRADTAGTLPTRSTVRRLLGWHLGRSPGQYRSMLGHIGINVADLTVAKAYYERLLPLLGFEEFFSRDDEFSFRPAGGKPGTFLFFYPSVETGEISRHRPGLQHLAFIVPAREAVATVYQAALALGSEPVHPPQEYPQYPPPYHAAFWLDPFGVMLEAVCHHDR